ncbi:lysine--tRNA ligase [Candidatus Parcubacteria bacterium]|uniref:Lysine--tRNA ligase n=1 Tax=Candidatus Kaiserbacteria bacterium CG10_big_fil_rev_8_21_14_0_10_47_16 TaxID=1974608 RepID=A0A2H0UDA4_9BACT|nr:lysine--tRNA ligase [Candidatus Parcubacteria bacterium]PIR84330.1 MAG: lysine--tRNA ligase [Candidatus Kaiserbacteria bacterium CG10_big_fil_rev_8_21_14_0_10_47_16]
MFWAEKIANDVVRKYDARIKKGESIIVRDEKTASGRVHVGSLRSASLHAIVADVLASEGVPVTFHFEINDFDPMDGIPSYLDEAEYTKYMGMQLYKIPSPEPGFDNFAELYGQEYVRVLEQLGFGAQVYRASELYLSGKMNDLIRTTLEKRNDIRRIYAEVSKSERPEDWHPLNVVCENCGKLSSTKVTDFDGETVAYTCSSDTISWAEGCGHSGRISPFDGNGKLPWKVEWAAKFVVLGVHFEGGGKDHYSKGGARQVAEAISREVFMFEPPYGVFNEFFLIGGKKMSSSKGNAATAVELAELLPTHILRLLLLKTPINRQIDFDPDGDAIPVLFDTYDRLAEKTWSGVEDDDSVLFQFVHTPAERSHIHKRFLPRFSQIAFFVQMPHMDVFEEVEKMKGSPLTDEDRTEVDLRVTYAKRWLETYADEKFIFVLQETLPPHAATLTNEQKQALAQFATRIELADEFTGESLHKLSHEIKEGLSGLSAGDFYAAIYAVFLGKESGPKIGWFLSTLDKDFVIKRLTLKA